MLDLNDPRDARAYVADAIAIGVLRISDDEDYRYYSDDYVLELAHRIFLQDSPILRLAPESLN